MFPLKVARIHPFKYIPSAEYKDALQKIGVAWPLSLLLGKKERPQPQEKPLAVENLGENLTR